MPPQTSTTPAQAPSDHPRRQDPVRPPATPSGSFLQPRLDVLRRRSPLWPPRQWPISVRSLAILAAGFVVLTAVWSLFGKALVAFLDATGLQRADERLSLWFEAQRTETLNDLSYWVSVTGDAIPKTIIMWVIALALTIVWRRLDLAVFLVTTMELERAAFGTTAGIIGRVRPPVEQLDVSSIDHSFPSGHVASSTTLYGALAIIVWAMCSSERVRRMAVGLAVAGTLLMLILRLYRGMHYLSDTLFGVLLGIASLGVGLVAITQAKIDVERRTRDSRQDPGPAAVDRPGARAYVD